MPDATDALRATAAAALFPTDGELTVDGLIESVNVRRDAWGAAYVEAASLDDLWFAQGFVTAGERLFQLDLTLRAANGRLSEIFAERTLADDRFARTIGFHRAGARLAADWDDLSLRMHARFREGVAAWISTMPAAPIEYTLLDIAPHVPVDVASWASAFAFQAWNLSGNWDSELLRAWIAERAGVDAAAKLLPPIGLEPVDAPAGALHGQILDAVPRSGAQGSNEWVVSGSRTTHGAPLLANDPHLLVLQPSPWIEFHLSAPGYRARGVALVFSPGILLGTTAHHAWGATNVSGDVQDLYVERLNDERTAVEFRGAWEPLTVHREEIVVRGEPEPHVVEVRESRHGPLLDTFVSGVLDPDLVELPPSPTYALRWVGADRAIQPSLTFAAANATSFEGFRTIALRLACPGQNFVYADVDGTIGYTCTGLYPVRRTGDGSAPVPGHTDDHEWDGSIPPDELPWSMDPPRGFLVTANNRIHDDSYPHLIGLDVHSPYRARRIAEVLDGRDDHDVSTMAALQVDTVSLPARRTLPLLLRIEPADEDARAALDVLRTWDGDMRADSPAAAIFNVWSRHIGLRALPPRIGPDVARHYLAWRETFQCEVLPVLLAERDHDGTWTDDGWLDDDMLREALRDAIEELRERTGSPGADGWRWGALHRLRLAHPLASIPGLDRLFVAVDAELGGDEQTVMQGGFDGRDGYPAAVIPSWRAVYDLGDLDRSVGVLPAGNSGNPASPNWNDQSALWLTGRTHSLPFTGAAVQRACVTNLRLQPATPA
jgi:penicillin G amidase